MNRREFCRTSGVSLAALATGIAYARQGGAEEAVAPFKFKSHRT